VNGRIIGFNKANIVIGKQSFKLACHGIKITASGQANWYIVTIPSKELPKSLIKS